MTERFNLLVVHPVDYVGYAPFLGAARLLYFGLRRLGYEVRLASNQFLRDVTNIIVGPHHLAGDLAEQLPAGTVIYNTEQIGPSNQVIESLRPFVARFELWDHSLANVAVWRSLGLGDRVRYLQPGYLPESTTIDPATPANIDVLFYGNVSPRRLTVLDAIARAGIDLQVVSGVYRRERDALIARARIVPNVHATETAALEIARVAHVLSNRRALVSELGPNAKIDPDLRDGIAAGVASELPGLCRALLADDRRRLALAERGFELFSRRDFSASLREVLGARDASRSR